MNNQSKMPTKETTEIYVLYPRGWVYGVCGLVNWKGDRILGCGVKTSLSDFYRPVSGNSGLFSSVALCKVCAGRMSSVIVYKKGR